MLVKGAPRTSAILYLVRPSAGGMRGHVQALLNHFGRIYPVCLASPDATGEGWPVAEEMYTCLPLAPGIDPAGDLRSFRGLLSLFRRYRPALLHVHGYKAALVGCPAAALAGVPVLVTVHNFCAHRGSDALFNCFKRLVNRGGVRCIAVSQALADDLTARGIFPGRITVIHNGIDPEPFERARHQRLASAGGKGVILVGAVARLAPQKGLIYLVHAAARLAARYPAMRFVIAGEGPERPVLQEQARRLGVADKLAFTGRCADLPRFLAGLDIFVLPSLTEGQAVTLLEASAAGCAVVATRVGGVPEVIRDGETGLLVPPGDPDSLAAAVSLLAERSVLARRLAAAARARVRRHFTLAQMLTKTEAVYGTWLKKVPGTIIN